MALKRKSKKFVWRRKHLLGVRDLSVEEIVHILDTAEGFEQISTRSVKKAPVLRGKVIVTLFFEDSTRTRTSFVLAASRLSADVIEFTKKTSSVSKGETLIDTARNLEAMGIDIVIVRHSAGGTAKILSKSINACVINAGDGFCEHPTQALLDVYTIRKKRGTLEGLKIAIVGDIAHSRVARSDMWAMTKLGAEVIFVGPPTLMPSNVDKLPVKLAVDLHRTVSVHPDIAMPVNRHTARSVELAVSEFQWTWTIGIYAARSSTEVADAPPFCQELEEKQFTGTG